MGALALSRRLADTLAQQEDTSGYARTRHGHPVAAAVALANLHILDQKGLVARAAGHTGPYFQQRLRERFGGHPVVGEIQGSGMVAALQLSPSPAEKRRFGADTAVGKHCVRQARERGLIAAAAGARIMLAPALIATHIQIDALVDMLGSAVDATGRAVGLM